MKRIISTAVAALAIASASAGVAAAQPYNGGHGSYGHESYGGSNGGGYGADNGRYDDRQVSRNGQRHSNWRAGSRVSRADWNRGQRVDYRRQNLRQPPRGYEYRRVDGDVILAAVATGLIISILAGH